MKCPFCGENRDRVVDSREQREGETIRRRRQCLACDRRFTSYEQIENIPYMVIKNDGSRQSFNRNKITNGLLKACEKRPISIAEVEEMVNSVENLLHTKPDREITTQEIGNVIMEGLQKLDQIAYIRFASVYRRFEDVDAFTEMVKTLPSKGPEDT